MRAASDPAARGPRHNPWLDLLRSLAIVLVLLRHGFRAAQDAFGLAPGIGANLMLNGWVGVDLFLVLSGYLIGGQLLRETRTGRFDYARYLIRRALRILPSYYAVLLLIVAGSFPLYVIERQDLSLRTLYHLLFLQDYLPSDINVVFWSLGVEEKFYLLAPILIALLVRPRSPGQAFAIVSLLLIASPLLRAITYAGLEKPVGYQTFFETLRSPFHACLEPLLAGALIAIAERAGLLAGRPRTGLLALIAGGAALSIWLASHEQMARIGAFDAVLQPMLNAAICATLVAGGVMLAGTRAPFAAPTQSVARLSYTLYLVHLPLLPLAIAVATAASHPVLTFWCLYPALALAASIVLHLGVERPFLAYRDRVVAPRVNLG